MDEKRVIAVSGKGGTGKTALVAIMAKILTRNRGLKILAIDADSAISLPQVLGITAEKTVSDIRKEIIEDPEARRRIAESHIGEVIKGIAKQGDGIKLLVMGRPEGSGCFCAVNDLLRYGIEGLSKDFAITLIDCEAGPEQINRRVVESVDTLIIISDDSARGARTADSIRQIAEAGGVLNTCTIAVVINRIRGETITTNKIREQLIGKIIGYIPEDKNISDYDLMDRPLLQLPDDSPSVLAVEKILKRIGLQP